LALAAGVTISWPLTGSLGDVLTSINICLQSLAQVVPEALLFWGLVFFWLTSTLNRPWGAAFITMIAYGLYVAGGFMPDANLNVGSSVLFLLPLAFVLTELRARGNAIYPLIPVAFCYRAVPTLFVDPRYTLYNGSPEPQHIISYAVAMTTAVLLGVGLWSGRQLMLVRREHPPSSARAWGVITTSAALVSWGIWGGLYVSMGQPGFANDGFLIILEEQADLSTAYSISDREVRLQYVYNTLVETAERTQFSLRTELDGLGVAYRPYYIINMIRVDGHRWLMPRFQGRPSVAQVILNPNVRRYPQHLVIPIPESQANRSASEMQPNLAAIHADAAWALGVTGEGIVVAGQDTGYDWPHPALKSHYRGWDGQSANHNYNWHDAWDNTPVPFDDGNHGTHTMGIVLGDDGAGERIGVAPGAQWIGCRNMRRGFGNPGAYAECLEYFLAPYPHNGDPFTDGRVNLAPHVVTNSWSCPVFEGCRPDTLKVGVEALRAAGIMMIASAGNDGPACGTVSTPPANYDTVFSVGATDNNGTIYFFSSRGPSSGPIKPNVVAPGYHVRSSLPSGRYGYNSGTSMAAPHVAGLVALMWSANPSLIGDIDTTETIIYQTAVPKPVQEICPDHGLMSGNPFAVRFAHSICACGGVKGAPNNVYGYGFINAETSVRATMAWRLAQRQTTR